MQDPAYAAAKARFARFDRGENLFALAAIPIAMWLSYLALRSLARLRYASLPQGIYTFVPDDFSRLPLAGLVGIMVAAAMVEVRRHVVLGSEATRRDALDHALVARTPERARLIERGCGVLMAALIVVMILASLNDYAVFGPEEALIRPWGSLREKHHRYGDITSIEWVQYVRGRRNRLIAMPHVSIRFADGTSWSSASTAWRSADTLDRQLATFLTRRTGLTVQRVRVDR